MAKLLNAQTGKQALSQTHVYECFALCNDIFKLLQVGFSELSVRRKMALRPKLSHDYRATIWFEKSLENIFFKSWIVKM